MVLASVFARRRVLLAALVSAALAALYAGAPLLGSLPVLCPLRALTGLACPGCGITRATAALLHGRWQAAWTLHPAAYLVVLAAGAAAVTALAEARRGRPYRLSAICCRAPAPFWAAIGLAAIHLLRHVGALGSIRPR